MFSAVLGEGRAFRLGFFFLSHRDTTFSSFSFRVVRSRVFLLLLSLRRCLLSEAFYWFFATSTLLSRGSY